MDSDKILFIFKVKPGGKASRNSVGLQTFTTEPNRNKRKHAFALTQNLNCHSVTLPGCALLSSNLAFTVLNAFEANSSIYGKFSK